MIQGFSGGGDPAGFNTGRGSILGNVNARGVSLTAAEIEKAKKKRVPKRSSGNITLGV